VLIVCFVLWGKTREKTPKKTKRQKNTCIPVGEADADVKGC
jgi:hypothetical protein